MVYRSLHFLPLTLYFAVLRLKTFLLNIKSGLQNLGLYLLSLRVALVQKSGVGTVFAKKQLIEYDRRLALMLAKDYLVTTIATLDD